MPSETNSSGRSLTINFCSEDISTTELQAALPGAQAVNTSSEQSARQGGLVRESVGESYDVQ